MSETYLATRPVDITVVESWLVDGYVAPVEVGSDDGRIVCASRGI
jgi:hypothetical protein